MIVTTEFMSFSEGNSTYPSAHIACLCIFFCVCLVQYYPLFLLLPYFQVDIPTIIIENVGKEGLKHLEMYLTAKEKGTM